MAGPFDIQRVPAGLQNLLNLFGPGTPPRLAEEITGNLDLLQFYGLQQRQTVVAVNAALPPVTALDCALNPGSNWALLFAASFGCGSAAAMTQVGMRISLQRGASGVFISYATHYPPFVVYPAAQSLTLAYVPPYPILLPPNSTLRGFFDLLVGVANASSSVSAEIGLFG